MANIDSVQLPDGSNFNIVDNTSNFATQTYVNNAVSGVTKTSIGLGNVDNTSDLSKPVSTAQQTAIDNAVAPKADQTLLAPVESTSTASQTYQIGDQFIYNGLLYKATAVINSGGTITPDGNCELSESITEQIANSGGGSISITTMTAASGMSFSSNYVMKKDNVVTISGTLVLGAEAIISSRIIGYLPAGYRPSVNKVVGIIGCVTSSAVTDIGRITISPNGEVGVQTIRAQACIQAVFSATFDI